MANNDGNGVNRPFRYVAERLQHSWNEAALQVESGYQGLRNRVRNTAPVIVVSRYDTVLPSFRRTYEIDSFQQIFQNTPAATAQDTTAALPQNYVQHDRNAIIEARGVYDAERAGAFSSQAQQDHVARIREVHRVNAVRQRMYEEARSRRGHQDVPTRVEHLAPQTRRYNLPRYNAASQTSQQRQQSIQASMSSIIGNDSVNNIANTVQSFGYLGVAGHPGLERIQQEAAQQAAHDRLREQQEQRRQAAERQQQELIQRQQIQAQLNFYQPRCVQRVRQLADQGADLDRGLEELIHAARHGQTDSMLNRIVPRLIYGILEAAERILRDMDNEIPLDVEGAEMLKRHWPCQKLYAVLEEYVRSQPDSQDLWYLTRLIQAILQRIVRPTPWVNPLERALQPLQNPWSVRHIPVPLQAPLPVAIALVAAPLPVPARVAAPAPVAVPARVAAPAPPPVPTLTPVAAAPAIAPAAAPIAAATTPAPASPVAPQNSGNGGNVNNNNNDNGVQDERQVGASVANTDPPANTTTATTTTPDHQHQARVEDERVEQQNTIPSPRPAILLPWHPSVPPPAHSELQAEPVHQARVTTGSEEEANTIPPRVETAIRLPWIDRPAAPPTALQPTVLTVVLPPLPVDVPSSLAAGTACDGVGGLMASLESAAPAGLAVLATPTVPMNPPHSPCSLRELGLSLIEGGEQRGEVRWTLPGSEEVGDGEEL